METLYTHALNGDTGAVGRTGAEGAVAGGGARGQCVVCVFVCLYMPVCLPILRGSMDAGVVMCGQRRAHSDASAFDLPNRHDMCTCTQTHQSGPRRPKMSAAAMKQQANKRKRQVCVCVRAT